MFPKTFVGEVRRAVDNGRALLVMQAGPRYVSMANS